MTSKFHMLKAPGTPTVFFDLDNTLFDHFNSLQSGLHAIRALYRLPAEIQDANLLKTYDRCLQEAYDQYLKNQISYEAKDIKKIKLFFLAVGLPEPNEVEVRRFQLIYDDAYMANRRATSGSVETLACLKSVGYRLAIISNGQVNDQIDKTKAIGIRDFFDYIFTSQEAGAAKPSSEIFNFAITKFQTSANNSYMVGDSLETDIKGAIGVGLHPVLYDPHATGYHRDFMGRQVPVIHTILELLEMLRIQ